MTKPRLYWLVWLFTVLGLYFFENNTGTRIILTASIMIPLVSAACAAWCASRVRLELDMPEVLWKNEPGNGSCTLTGSPLLAACSLTGNLCITDLLTAERSERRMALSEAEPVRFSVSAEHCGTLSAEFADAAVSDWFGLWHFPVSETERKTVTVYPDLYPVRISDSDRPGNRSADLREQMLKSGSDSPVSGDIREYVPGDPIRQIHWKLSEKTDRLLIREPAHSSEKSIRLQLDVFRQDALPERINDTVEALLSASRALAAEGYAHEVCWADTEKNDLCRSEIASEPDFRALQEAVLLIRRTAGTEMPEVLPSGPIDDRLLVFDASSDAPCCSRNDPVLEL